jgi:hypothetical protein
MKGGWIRLHNEELHNSCASTDITRLTKSRRMRWAGHVARMGDMRNAYNILVGKPEGKRLFGRPRHTWEGNIRIYLRKVGWKVVAQDGDQRRALVNTVMNLRVP